MGLADRPLQGSCFKVLTLNNPTAFSEVATKHGDLCAPERWFRTVTYNIAKWQIMFLRIGYARAHSLYVGVRNEDENHEIDRDQQ